MSSSINNVIDEVILISSHPCLKASSWIFDSLFGFYYFPSYLLQILIGFVVRDHGVNISGIEKYLKPCFFEGLEKRNSCSSVSIDLTDLIATGSPLGWLYV